jgi:hypothetical protein
MQAPEMRAGRSDQWLVIGAQRAITNLSKNGAVVSSSIR